MSKVLYNSRSELDKLPFGAVANDEKIRFGIRVCNSCDAQAVSLVFQRDENGEEIRFDLKPVWQYKGYTRFEESLSLKTPDLYWYHFELVCSGETRLIGKTKDGAGFLSSSPEKFQLSVYDKDYKTPQWIKGGLFYHIFVDRFRKKGDSPLKPTAVMRDDWGGVPHFLPDKNGEILNNDFFGGNLEGIIEKLPYFQKLGVSCLYLSPIFEAASNHKYDTGDYMKIDPSFGNDDTLRKLCSEAKKYGIRVILDGVFNHTGSDSRYFNRNGSYGELGAYQSKDSKYYDWYSFTEFPDKYESWWGIKTLPQVREENPSFLNYICGEKGVLEKWMSLGAAGWRLDVADELPDIFLEKLRERVKAEDEEALVIGEVWEDASKKLAYGKRRRYFQGAQLDSVMNYPFKNAIINFIKGGNAEVFQETVESICENYPKPSLDCLMNGLGTHDTARILTVLSGKEYPSREERAAALFSDGELQNAKELLRLASFLQFTLPGVPCIYYGDEVGLYGYEDPFNRRCYPWGNEDTELLSWYERLSGARHSCPAFAGGEYKTLKAKDSVFIFLRENGSKKALCAMNMGAGDLILETAEHDRFLIGHNCLENSGRITINPRGCALLEQKSL
ncbi:MAG: glycoside hydrolase family 13 protein [Clostridiales bacterium]|nr:glycoside hydrolase family 13 protein [Clostridiales bacterium]